MSQIFKQRLTCPAKDNKYYVNTAGGGYNTAIRVTGNWALPNCVGYCVGRWMEALGITKFDLGTNLRNAEEWYIYADKKYTRGKTPRIGAIICWQKGKIGKADGAGHIAYVEQVNADGSILISESAYGSYTFKTETVKKGYARKNMTFQGFIYPPVEFVLEADKPKFVVGRTYTLLEEMKVRKGPGINYAAKTHKELTKDGQAHDKDNDGCLDKGTVVSCLETKNVGNDIWVRTPSGWIAAYYNKTTYMK